MKKKHLCEECGKAGKTLIPCAELADGKKLYCCRVCWLRLDYNVFMWARVG